MALMQHRVVHIHPTLLCNLACAHCYSTSSPAASAGLDPKDILHATKQLRRHGFQTASISGGEPTVYAGLDDLCAGVLDQGYRLSVITNGLLTKRVLALSKTFRPNVIAVSFDGLAPRHDLIRRRQGSFDKAIETLRALTNAGQRTGVVLSFGEDGIEDLPDLLDIIISAGAQTVQFHPVAKVGRGRTEAIVKAPTPETLLRVLLMTRLFQTLYPEIPIECDALTGQELADRCVPAEGSPLSPVVIGSDGVVGPIAYGLGGRFGLGHVGERLSEPVFSKELAELAQQVMKLEASKPATEFYEAFERHVSDVLALV